MKAYELVYIIKPGDDEVINATIAKFENLIKNNGGVIEKLDRWGKKRLAYEIKDFTDGFYVLVNFNAEPKTVHELERVMKITDEVIRHLLLVKE
jgi:small subunit ribosomal protein S6